MNKSSKKVIPKKRGRPATGKAPMVSFRMSADRIDAIEKWAARLPDKPLRSEAIRRLVERGLAASRPTNKHGVEIAAKAADKAAQTIEKIVDASVSSEERATRKRRLLKGPREFRDLRTDLPRPKR
jgi:hypothetical protein